ncbi:TorF family putative porin [Qipengyuania sp. JC766]|uniref:TorF family putative porin n=1 Tax=Qipengyuania sp. JC766 TaxID=3232139 RepID=UPI00345A4A9B
MLTSTRGLLAASLFALPAFAALPAAAQDVTDPPSEIEISGNVALTSDYRFRGVSLSNGDPAIQGGIDVAHESGIYVGTWASSIEGGPSFGEMELDLYAGWSGDVADGVGLDVGILYYLYPTENIDANVNYWEPYASISGSLGPAEAELGIAYAWDQDSLGGDNLYVYTDFSTGVPNTPISLNAHIGYTDGVLAPPILAGTTDDTGFDYSIGASATFFGKLEASVAYVAVDGPEVDGLTDDTVVATLSMSF